MGFPILHSHSLDWLPNSHLFSDEFFAQFWGPRDGPKGYPKARDGHDVSA